MLFFNYRNIDSLLLCVHDGDKYMVIVLVILLVIMYVVENRASWCTGFDPVWVCSGPMVWIQKRVSSSIWESVKCYL